MGQSEYLKWLQWVAEHPEVEERFPKGGCEGCTNDCAPCIMGLCSFDSREDELEESEQAFLSAVTYSVENFVEEFYLHPNWTPEENEEYGIEWGYLVDLYFRLQKRPVKVVVIKIPLYTANDRNFPRPLSDEEVERAYHDITAHGEIGGWSFSSVEVQDSTFEQITF